MTDVVDGFTISGAPYRISVSMIPAYSPPDRLIDGATSYQTWIQPGIPLTGPSPTTCFNGAMPFQTWIHYSPLGISATKMKVMGMVLRPCDTEIWVNSVDTALQNKLSDGWGRLKMAEAFLSPVGFAETICLQMYDGFVITDDPAYIGFADNTGTEMTGWRAPCTIYANTDYNLRTYHAESEVGHSPGNAPIECLKLWDAVEGGSAVGSLDLNRTVSSIEIDNRFNKFYKSRVVVDYNCKGS